MAKNPKISVAKLRSMGACEEGVDMFRDAFGARTVSLAKVLTSQKEDPTYGKEWLVYRLLPKINASAMRQLTRWWAAQYSTVPSSLVLSTRMGTAWEACCNGDDNEDDHMYKLQAFTDYFVLGKKAKV